MLRVDKDVFWFCTVKSDIRDIDKSEFAKVKSNEKEMENNILGTITCHFYCWFYLFNHFEKNICHSFICYYYIDDRMVVV